MRPNKEATEDMPILECGDRAPRWKAATRDDVGHAKMFRLEHCTTWLDNLRDVGLSLLDE